MRRGRSPIVQQMSLSRLLPSAPWVDELWAAVDLEAGFRVTHRGTWGGPDGWAAARARWAGTRAPWRELAAGVRAERDGWRMD